MRYNEVSYYKATRKKTRASIENVMSFRLGKVTKGARGMPRLMEAMKDVTSCDKPGVAANKFRYLDFRMGQPVRLKA